MPLEAIPREKILSVIDQIGPVQPLDVRRTLGSGELMLIGAVLSEMASSGIISISKTKRGGSPFYYNPQKKETLETISQYLGEKDKRTYDLLKENKVLNEKTQDPLTRVSLQNIPDFSRRFTLGEETFWRYYLVSEQEAMKLVKPDKPSPKQEEKQKTLVKEEAEPVVAGELFEQVKSFAQQQDGTLSEENIIKQNAELTCIMKVPGKYGPLAMMVYALNRKTLPEKLVWKILLDVKGKGLPLLVLNTNNFPKTLEKKFSDISNVYFKRL